MCADTVMDFSAAAAAPSHFQFDIRPHFNSFKRPTFIDVLNSVRAAFPDDGSLVVREGFGRMLGLFNVFASSQPTELFIKFSRLKSFDSADLEVISIPLTPPEQHRVRARDGLLITIVDADLDANRAIPGRLFDSALEAYGTIEVGTQSQKYRGSKIYNGNRCCVIKKNESKELPDRLSVGDNSFLIKYKGKQWNCQSCKEMHIGPCPYKKALYAARDKRNEAQICHHVVSDSTLRYADQSGLLADVSVVSGATIGQLANAVDNDDDVERHRHVVLAAGANDTLVGELENDHQIVKRVDKSLNRFLETVNRDEARNFYVFNTCRPLEFPTRRQFIAREYFEMRLRKVASYVENLDIIKTCEGLTGWEEDGHPSRDLTKDILMNISRDLENDIVIDDSVITNEKIYRGVNGHYLSGCSGCATFGMYDEGGFCPTCVAKMSTQKKMQDDKLFKKVLGMALDKYPVNNGKRQLSDDDENVSKKSS